MKEIARGLCAGGQWRAAWRLLMASRAGRLCVHECVEKPWATLLVHRKHPLDALAQAKSSLERHCIMRLILEDASGMLLPPSGSMMISIVSSMADIDAIFCDQMHPTLTAIGEQRTAYTYQLVQRGKARAVEETRASVGGEVARRAFLSFGNAALALNFVETWQHAQHRAFRDNRSSEATCLLECGTHDATLRKWVLDVDASVVELKKAGLCVDAAVLHEMTMAMAVAVAQALFALGFLYRPCHFSVTTRHSIKKMSWHITLNALASHDRWRRALNVMEQKYDIPKLGRMYEFVDKGTKNNSMSQYMQMRGSTKVTLGAKADGNFFRDAGLFDGHGRSVEVVPASRYSILFYAATSVVVHDPWSLPFVTTPGEAEAKALLRDEETALQRKKRRGAPSAPATASKRGKPMAQAGEEAECAMPLHRTGWDGVPAEEATWMQALLERKDGATKLVTIPSMSNPQYWCDTAVQMVNAGRGTVRLYAKVLNPVLCPKHLKASQKIYRHGSNHSMVAVVEETHPSFHNTSFRLFTRCFSEKCRVIRSPHCSPCGWVELGKPDFFLVRALEARH